MNDWNKISPIKFYFLSHLLNLTLQNETSIPRKYFFYDYYLTTFLVRNVRERIPIEPNGSRNNGALIC